MQYKDWRFYAIILVIGFVLTLPIVLSGARPAIGGVIVWVLALALAFRKRLTPREDPVKDARQLDATWTEADKQALRDLMERRK